MMFDFFGNELRLGDTVAFRVTQKNAGSALTSGTVVGFTPKKVKLSFVRYNGSPESETVIDPHNCVKYFYWSTVR